MEASELRATCGLDSKTRSAPAAWITMRLREPCRKLAGRFRLLSTYAEVCAQEPAHGPGPGGDKYINRAEVVTGRRKKRSERGHRYRGGEDTPSVAGQ